MSGSCPLLFVLLGLSSFALCLYSLSSLQTRQRKKRELRLDKHMAKGL